MSRRSLSTQDQRILLAEAGGQCEFEGCPEFIYEDMLTKQNSILENMLILSGIPKMVHEGILFYLMSIALIEKIFYYFVLNITR